MWCANYFPGLHEWSARDALCCEAVCLRELSSTVFFIVAEILQHVQVAFFDEPVVELRGGYARRGPKISQRPTNHWVGARDHICLHTQEVLCYTDNEKTNDSLQTILVCLNSLQVSRCFEKNDNSQENNN